MIGKTLGGKYKIYDKVGGGGMAEVYLARDITKGQIVALKILREQYTQGADYVERFKREAESAMKLNHENICAVMDFGSEDQTYYMVMEFIEGKTLTSMIEQQGPLPLADAISYMLQSVKALDKAYKSGIIAHRDIKSQNLMVTPAGQIKIMDFGIAKSRDFATMTTAGSFIGTPEYMSPEQAQGLKVDQRTDIYSLGIVFYEMLAGEVPFESDTPWGVLNMHINKEPFPLANLRKDIPQEVVEVIGHMLAKNPDDRFQNTNELLSAISGLAVKYGGTKNTVVKAKKVPRSNPRVKRNILKIAGIIGAAAILVFGFLFGWQMLKPKPGGITITSTPSGAEILMKGISEKDFVNYGVTPLEIPQLDAGAYDLKLHLEGYVDNTKQIEIKPGEKQIADTVEMTKPGTLTLSSPASISWGKVEAIPGPKDIVIKNTGGYVLKVTKDIGADWISIDKDDVTLEKGLSKTIPVSINPLRIKPGQKYSGTITLKPDFGEPVKISVNLEFSATGSVETNETPKTNQQTGNTNNSGSTSNTGNKGNTGNTGNTGNSGNTGKQNPPPVKDGTIIISCNVGTAAIKINGSQVGTGSATVTRPAGTYTIEIVAGGYKSPPNYLPIPYKTTITLAAGQTYTLPKVILRK